MSANSHQDEVSAVLAEQLFPWDFPTIKPGGIQIEQVQAASLSAGIKSENLLDLSVIQLPAGSQVHAVTTSHRLPAAPVLAVREQLGNLDIQQPVLLWVNSGNANAATGKQGAEDVSTMAGNIAQLWQIPSVNIYPFSTGVIGAHLPINKMVEALPNLLTKLANQATTPWLDIATSMMTTDTVSKLFHTTFMIEGHEYKAVGIAKGAAMIHPNMGTMLAYVITDAPLDFAQLSCLNTELTNSSFNRISVDGDTSTNDCMTLATTKGGLAATQELLQKVKLALKPLYQRLAMAIVSDAEGGSKVLRVCVHGAPKQSFADQLSRDISASALIKTALTAADPNWGRIYMALGNSLAKIDIQTVNPEDFSLSICGYPVLKKGQLVENYDEKPVALAMQANQVDVAIHWHGENISGYNSVALSSDLSQEYVRLNSEYRT